MSSSRAVVATGAAGGAQKVTPPRFASPIAALKNAQTASYIRGIVSLLVALALGIVGVTGYAGFLAYLIAHVASAGVLLLMMAAPPAEYFPQASLAGFIFSGVADNAVLFIFLWTIACVALAEWRVLSAVRPACASPRRRGRCLPTRSGWRRRETQRRAQREFAAERDPRCGRIRGADRCMFRGDVLRCGGLAKQIARNSRGGFTGGRLVYSDEPAHFRSTTTFILLHLFDKQQR